ncbi:hypothetical protein, partial [Mediterranea massiliensis]|uniref:hypothetical protein n=1 Tax=Mediterranea massiliensis TaxID=1841865 RepID=UPI001960BED4
VTFKHYLWDILTWFPKIQKIRETGKFWLREVRACPFFFCRHKKGHLKVYLRQPLFLYDPTINLQRIKDQSLSLSWAKQPFKLEKAIVYPA